MKPLHQHLSLFSNASLTLAAIAFSAISLRAANLDVIGDLDVSGSIDYGTTSGSSPTSAVLLSYYASTMNARFTLTPNNGVFAWRDNAISGSAATKMKLDGNNILTLYNSTGTTTISLNPTNGQINLAGTGSGIYSNGSAVFTVDASGNLVFANRPFGFSSTTESTSSTTGAVTISGGLGVAKDAFINGIRIGEGGGSLASNTAIGYASLNANTSGLHNTASGYYALRLNTTGSYNTASGRAALESNTTGSSNLAAGYAALYPNTTGSYNVALGQNAGRYLGDGQALTDPENSIYIGANSRAFSNDDVNSIVIGTSAVGEGANTTVIGNSTTTKTHLFGETVVNSLSVTSATVLNGQVTLAAPQGDISMGDYAN